MSCCICQSPVHRVYEAYNQPLARYGMQTSLEAALSIESINSITIDECVLCGFARNSSFTPGSVEYDELPVLESAGFSPDYRKFQLSAANRINTYFSNGLNEVVEIGGGDGFFISNIQAKKRVVYEPGLEANDVPDGIQCVPEYFTPAINTFDADLVIMRQVLEHLPSPVEFIRDLINSRKPSSNNDPLYLYLEVPSHEQTKRYSRFCDFYYEHCNYFTLSSLSLLASRTGGQICFSEALRNDEILTLMIRYSHSKGKSTTSYAATHTRLTKVLQYFKNQGKLTAVWGLSGNGVTMLNSLKASKDLVSLIIDSDVRKQGLYAPVTGQRVTSPEEASRLNIDCIIIASQFHCHEIREMCKLLFGSARIFGPSGDELT